MIAAAYRRLRRLLGISVGLGGPLLVVPWVALLLVAGLVLVALLLVLTLYFEGPSRRVRELVRELHGPPPRTAREDLRGHVLSRGGSSASAIGAGRRRARVDVG